MTCPSYELDPFNRRVDNESPLPFAKRAQAQIDAAFELHARNPAPKQLAPMQPYVFSDEELS